MGGGANELFPLSYIANEALVKHRFVKLAGDQLVDQADAQGERILGVGRFDVSAAEATDGKEQNVDVLGAPFVEADEALTRGTVVVTTAAGRAEPGATGDIPAGIVLKSCTAQGDLVPILLTPGLPALA